MLISGRQAATVLEQAGLARRQARRVLAAGFAGSARITTSAHYYELERVAEVASRPLLSDEQLDEIFERELFIARRDIDLASSAAARLSALRSGWDLSAPTCVLLRFRIDQHGCVPLVATVGSFVAMGAEITAVWRGGRHGSTLDLRDPGPWFDEVRGHRIASGPGRDFVIRGWQLFARQAGRPTRPAAG